MPYPTAVSSRQYKEGEGFPASKIGKRSDEEKAQDAEKYLNTLAERRLPWETMIDNIMRFVNHSRRRIQDKDLWPGQKTGMDIYDDTPLLAANLLVDGMVGYLCSRNMPWFSLTLPGKLNFPRTSGMRRWNGKRMDEYPQVAQWLQDSQTVMYSAFQRSNFYDVISEFVRDGVSAGTSHLLIEEEEGAGRIVFTVPHFRECYIAVNQWGRVDTNYRLYKMTLRQLADKFGMQAMQKVDPGFEGSYNSNMHAEREILHAVYPRADFDPGRIDAKSKKWESIWVYRKGGVLISQRANTPTSDQAHLVEESGYDSMPMITWRWRTNSDEWYGRGPSHDCYVSIMLAQQEGRTNLEAGQKMANPPLVAYSDQRGAIQRGPNGVTFMENNRGDIRARAPFPLNTGISQNLPFALEFQKDIRETINKHFHTEFFLLLSQLAQDKNVERTATEVMELMGEKAAILGTRIGMFQSEAQDPIIARVYDIESRAGRIPDPPAILLNTVHDGVKIQYLGPLAQAQTRLTKLRTIQTGLSIVGQIGQMNNVALDVPDWDEAVKESLKAIDFPQTCIRTDDMITKIRASRLKQQQQAQQIEALPKVARAAQAASKSPEAGSIMDKMMGGGKEKEANA